VPSTTVKSMSGLDSRSWIKVAPQAAPPAQRQRPGLCLGRPARAHAGPPTGTLIKEAHLATGQVQPP
jgi:hypothetical protein